MARTKKRRLGCWLAVGGLLLAPVLAVAGAYVWLFPMGRWALAAYYDDLEAQGLPMTVEEAPRPWDPEPEYHAGPRETGFWGLFLAGKAETELGTGLWRKLDSAFPSMMSLEGYWKLAAAAEKEGGERLAAIAEAVQAAPSEPGDLGSFDRLRRYQLYVPMRADMMVLLGDAFRAQMDGDLTTAAASIDALLRYCEHLRSAPKSGYLILAVDGIGEALDVFVYLLADAPEMPTENIRALISRLYWRDVAKWDAYKGDLLKLQPAKPLGNASLFSYDLSTANGWARAYADAPRNTLRHAQNAITIFESFDAPVPRILGAHPYLRARHLLDARYPPRPISGMQAIDRAVDAAVTNLVDHNVHSGGYDLTFLWHPPDFREHHYVTYWRQIRHEIRLDLAKIHIALHRYRKMFGNFPQSLDKLPSAFIETIPLDRATGGPLRYQVTSDGEQYLLASAGPNGRFDFKVTAPTTNWDVFRTPFGQYVRPGDDVLLGLFPSSS